MKSYDHSFHAYIQGIILIGFALLMLWLVLSGNIVFYIAPMMMPFIYFAMITFFVLGIMQIFRSTSKDGEGEHQCSCESDHQIKGPAWVKVLIYSIFIFPIIFGFVLPDRMLNSEAAANRGIQYGSGLNINTTQDGTQGISSEEGSTSRADAFLEDPESYYDNNFGQDDDDIEHFQIEDFYDQDWFNEFYEEFAYELEQEDVITVTEENYLDVMTVLDLYLDRFVGKEIEIIGFAFREPDFEDHQIVIARFAMTCCTADVGVYGTLIESDEAHYFDDDTWLYAKGTITKGQYHDFVLPIIVDSYLVEVDQPDTPYVYPSFNR
ncbi:putative membrane protein [Evansella vedderi]|uniref:Membrane protein n=1 Tax=Evansella vedderi TaxID=38282 RepID=A0ABT9ZY52_9BACI|nr:TIGR03943 family protein [Evansella vedderi]MDQ0256168.1 putative membrane protein [Evansella vedderi]